MRYTDNLNSVFKGLAKPAVITGVYLITFVMLVLFKHISLELPPDKYNPLYPGNLFIIISFLVLIILQFYFLKKKKSSDKPALVKMIVLATLSLLFLLAAGILKLSGIKFPDEYILRQPIGRTITGGLLIGFLVTHYYLISYLWFRISGAKSFVPLRSILNSIFILFVLFVFTFFYSQAGLTNKFESGKEGERRVAVVLGAAVWSGNRPSDVLVSRVDKSMELYRSGIVSKIQLMGGNAPGELSEARVAYNYLTELNIPREDVMIEESTSSTTEQVKYINIVLAEKMNFRDIIIISDRFHLVRINEIAKFYDLKVSLISSDMKLSKTSLFYHRVREGIALLIFWLFGL
ncbi:MAG: YdcF family protein [Ignavibacteriaceae bacterium]